MILNLVMFLMSMASNMMFISSKSKLVQPEVNLGIILGFVCTHRLSRLVGKIKAKELIMTGKMLSAKEAYQLGLVNSIFKDNELMEQVLKVVNEILTKAPLAIAMTKRAINEGIEMPLKV